jgi:hypothetical protein
MPKEHGITHDLKKCICSIYFNEHIPLYIIITCHHHVAPAIGAVLCLCLAAYWFAYCPCPDPSVTCDLSPCPSAELLSSSDKLAIQVVLHDSNAAVSSYC